MRTVQMKESGISWIGKIPQNWNTIKMKFVGDPIIGLTYKPEEIVDENEGDLVLRSSNIQDGKFSDHDNVYVNSEIPEKLRTKEGDILICSRNGSRKLIGKNLLINQDLAGSTFGAFMSVFRTDYSKWVYHVLNSPIFKAQANLFLTSTINQLTTSTLKNLVIPFPSDSEERESISNFLDQKTAQIDALIEKKEKLIKLLERQRQASIDQAVTKGLDPNVPMKDSGVEWIGEIPEGWSVSKLKYLADINGGGTPSSSKDEFWDGNVNWVTTDDLGKLKDGEKYISETRRTITELGADQIAGGLSQPNDIMISCRAPIGHLGILKIPATCNQGCKSLAPYENVDYRYLYYFLKYARPFIELEGSGSTFTEISGMKLKNVIALCPPLSDQTRIGLELEEFDSKQFEIIEKLNIQIDKLNSYKDSLIFHAVTGKIDVNA